MSASLNFKIGQSIRHPELGDGVVVGIEPSGLVQVFFRTHGERMVPATTLEQSLTWEQQVIAGLRPGTPEAVEQLWLALEAAELPLMESAATLTSAKVDLLPHQVVLVHRIANASPRRFLIADEVGLGKTIETALVLRELASRGELTRALIVAPAGLVENWRRELNDVFNLACTFLRRSPRLYPQCRCGTRITREAEPHRVFAHECGQHVAHPRMMLTLCFYGSRGWVRSCQLSYFLLTIGLLLRKPKMLRGTCTLTTEDRGFSEEV